MTKEKILEFSSYIIHLYKEYKKYQNKPREKEIYDTYLAAVKEFQRMCEEYYHLNLSVDKYWRLILEERKKKEDEEIHERVSR